MKAAMYARYSPGCDRDKPSTLVVRDWGGGFQTYWLARPNTTMKKFRAVKMP